MASLGGVQVAKSVVEATGTLRKGMRSCCWCTGSSGRWPGSRNGVRAVLARGTSWPGDWGSAVGGGWGGAGAPPCRPVTTRRGAAAVRVGWPGGTGVAWAPLHGCTVRTRTTTATRAPSADEHLASGVTGGARRPAVGLRRPRVGGGRSCPAHRSVICIRRRVGAPSVGWMGRRAVVVGSWTGRPSSVGHFGGTRPDRRRPLRSACRMGPVSGRSGRCAGSAGAVAAVRLSSVAPDGQSVAAAAADPGRRDR